MIPGERQSITFRTGVTRRTMPCPVESCRGVIFLHSLDPEPRAGLCPVCLGMLTEVEPGVYRWTGRWPDPPIAAPAARPRWPLWLILALWLAYIAVCMLAARAAFAHGRAAAASDNARDLHSVENDVNRAHTADLPRSRIWNATRTY